jgi:5-methylcytosine-specific restriction protein A
MAGQNNARPWAGLYGARWRRERRVHLARNPLCVMCQEAGRPALATIVDHKTPHRGDVRLFWDKGNWQSLCTPHHDRVKQSIEKRGTDAEPHDVDGYKAGW